MHPKAKTKLRKDEPTTEQLYKVIEALMERNDQLEYENCQLKKSLANNKMAAPTPTVLRALAIFGD